MGTTAQLCNRLFSAVARPPTQRAQLGAVQLRVESDTNLGFGAGFLLACLCRPDAQRKMNSPSATLAVRLGLWFLLGRGHLSLGLSSLKQSFRQPPKIRLARRIQLRHSKDRCTRTASPFFSMTFSAAIK